MAVMFNKKKNYTVLKESFKVPASMLNILDANDVAFAMNDTALELTSPSGYKKLHSFNTLVNSAVKYPTPEIIAKVNAFVSNFINENDTLPKSPTTLGQLMKDTLSNNQSPPIPTSTVSKEGYTTSFKIKQADVDKLPVVKLRDATALYQRVHGTSGGSVYRVIAMNATLRIAARVKNDSVSIRVEGLINSAVVNAFTPLGLQKKSDEYMSGHFTCEKCTPQKLIGSVLVGSGLYFDTPIPVIDTKVFA